MRKRTTDVGGDPQPDDIGRGYTGEHLTLSQIVSSSGLLGSLMLRASSSLEIKLCQAPFLVVPSYVANLAGRHWSEDLKGWFDRMKKSPF